MCAAVRATADKRRQEREGAAPFLRQRLLAAAHLADEVLATAAVVLHNQIAAALTLCQVPTPRFLVFGDDVRAAVVALVAQHVLPRVDVARLEEAPNAAASGGQG